MVICFHTVYERTSIQAVRLVLTMVWYAEASLCGINTAISDALARSSIEILFAAHSRDTEVSDG